MLNTYIVITGTIFILCWAVKCAAKAIMDKLRDDQGYFRGKLREALEWFGIY